MASSADDWKTTYAKALRVMSGATPAAKIETPPHPSTPAERAKRPPFEPTFEQSRRYFEARLPGQRIGSRRNVKCPFHDDGTASMSIKLEIGAWFCHACNVSGGILDFERKLTGKDDAECWAAINATIGREAPRASKPKRGRIVGNYDYRDASGKVVYQGVRFAEPKSFQQRRPDGKGGWTWNMDGVVRVPFNLPALVRANVALIAEGEKDALNLQKAAAEFPNENGTLSYAATTNIAGAGKWLDSYSPYLAGKKVFVFQDNDKAGREHAQQVCASVHRYAQGVHLVELPGLAEHGDVSDYLETHTSAQLFELIKAAPVWTAPVSAPKPAMTEADAARITAELLRQCRAWILRYIVVSDEQAIIMAAWILHTYAFEAAETTPYIHITAPERACGKSRLMESLEALSAAPIRSGGMTAAALVRSIDAKKPTIFLDEMDAQLGAAKEFAEAIRGILNEGFRKGGVFHKCVGKDFDLRPFCVYCPKCFAGIGVLPDTVSSRSIVIEMRRKLPGEAVEPFRQRAVKIAAAPIRAALEEWAAQGAVSLLQEIEPSPIASLDDRQNDIAEPLLAIAQLAGHGWLQRLSGAAHSVFKADGTEDTSIGATLLSDIRAVFDERKTDTVPSKMMADCLCAIEGRPWAEWSHGKGLTPNNLARQLKRFGVKPQTIRVGTGTPKGYRRGDFEDVWARYCPSSPIPTATPPQPASLLAETAFSNRNTQPAVAVAKSASNPHEQRSVAAVAVQNPDNAEKGAEDADPQSGDAAESDESETVKPEVRL